MRLISVVIGTKSTKDRFNITTNLLNYGFNNYENKKVLGIDDEISNKVIIKGAKNSNVNLGYEKDFYYLSKKGEKTNFKIKLELNNRVKAPVKKNDVLGKAYIINDGVVVGEINVVSKDNINKVNYKDCFDKVVKNYKIA